MIVVKNIYANGDYVVATVNTTLAGWKAYIGGSSYEYLDGSKTKLVKVELLSEKKVLCVVRGGNGASICDEGMKRLDGVYYDVEGKWKRKAIDKCIALGASHIRWKIRTKVICSREMQEVKAKLASKMFRHRDFLPRPCPALHSMTLFAGHLKEAGFRGFVAFRLAYEVNRLYRNEENEKAMDLWFKLESYCKRHSEEVNLYCVINDVCSGVEHMVR